MSKLDPELALIGVLLAVTMGAGIFAIRYTPSLFIPEILTAHAGCAMGLCAISRWLQTEDPEGSTGVTRLFSRLLWPFVALFFMALGALIVLAHS